MDAVTAFLKGTLNEEIYMKQQEAMDDGTGRVCKLQKSIYGLKQASIVRVGRSKKRSWPVYLLSCFIK